MSVTDQMLPPVYRDAFGGTGGHQGGLYITLHRVMFSPQYLLLTKNSLGAVEKRNNSTLCLHGSQLNSVCWGSKFFLLDEIHLYGEVQGSVSPFCLAGTQG